MTLRFDLPPDAEARLRDRASASGLSPEEYARRLVENAVRNGASEQGTLGPGEAQQRAKALDEWFASHRAASNGGVDDSRGSIYAGRGE